jgi:hypothetical protein
MEATIMAGILSKGITLSYKTGEGEFIALTNLQEIPELGNNAREKVEVTTLADDNKMYIAGLGDSGQDLAFKFLHEKEQFSTLAAIVDKCDWKVELPDGITATFSGTPSVKMAGAAANAALTYTLNITVESAIAFA